MAIPGGVVFCDDVRREESGKEIVIGIYANNIIVPELPAVLPQLWTIATVTFSPDEQVREAAMRLELPGGKVLKQEPVKIMAPMPVQQGHQYRYLKFRSQFQQVDLPERGRVRLVAEIDGVDLRIGSLEVLEARTVIPTNPGALLASYFHRAAKEITAHSSTKEELGANFQTWANDFAQIIGDAPTSADEPIGDAIALPHPLGLKALFVRPVPPEVEIEVTGLQPDNKWSIVERTPFSAVVQVERTPVPLNEVTVSLREKAAKAVRARKPRRK